MSAVAEQAGDALRPGFSHYDQTQVAARYLRRVDESSAEVQLALDNVHCASCVFRIEHGLAGLTGVQQVQVTPVSGRALITLDPRRLPLSTLLHTLEDLGFPPRPVAAGSVQGDGAGQDERRAALGRLGVAGLGMMQVMMYSAGQYLGAFQGIDPAIDRLLGLVSLVVATPVVFYSGQTFFASAWRGLRSGLLGMDVPVALGIGLAYAWSVWIMLGPDQWVPVGAHTYFDSVVMLIFLLLLGRFVEMGVRHQAGERRDALARLLPSTVRMITEDGGEAIVERDMLQVGDRVRLVAGDAVPADGEIVAGRGEIDEAMLTGESLAQLRAVGERLFGGTLLVGGSVDLRIEAVHEGSVLAQIERLMDKAQAERPPLAGLADRIARYFVLALILIAVVVGAVWWQHDPSRMLPVVLSVLVVTCPCALSLATPAALAASTAALSRRGLLVTRSAAIESLARINAAVFDKTGTLTLAEPALRAVYRTDDTEGEDDLLSVAAALEGHSRHPLAAAFTQWRGRLQAEEITSEVGRGIEGTIDGTRWRIGRQDFVVELARASASVGEQIARLTDQAPAASAIEIWLGNDRGVAARLLLDDHPRPDAAQTLQALEGRDVRTLIASGDGAQSVRQVATALGVSDAYWRQSPGDKLALIRRLQTQGHLVAMVGDGINDAPVLSGADVSVALAGGADLARVSADIVLLGERLQPLALAVDHARRTLTIIRQNLLWAAGYNVIALPLAAAGLVAPWMAAIGMSLSSLVVVGNALRLRRTERTPAAAARKPSPGTSGTAASVGG